MNKTLLVAAILLLGLGGLAAAYFWPEPDPESAWVLVDAEQVLHDVTAEQEVKVTFRLTNVSRRPFRILGYAVC